MNQLRHDSAYNDHTRALVPLEAWEYHSPFLKYQGRHTDLGLLAEALIYFDRVFVDVPTPQQLQDLVGWFIRYDHIETLIRLIAEGTLNFHYHAFMTSALNDRDVYRIVSIEDETQGHLHSFFPKVANHVDLSMLSSGKRKKLLDEIWAHHIESKASEYGPAVENANHALQQPARASFLLQTALDDLYRRLNAGKPPQAACTIEERSPGVWNITWDYDLTTIARLTGGKLNFRVDIPVHGEAHSNRFIWTAARHLMDLYLGDVMSTLTGNKLAEADDTRGKTDSAMRMLKVQVPFPDVRAEVNRGRIELPTVLEIRDHSSQFREWLRQGAELDRDMLHAYYHDIAKKSGFLQTAQSTLTIVGAASTIAAAGIPLAGATAMQEAVVASVAGVADFLTILAAKLNQG